MITPGVVVRPVQQGRDAPLVKVLVVRAPVRVARVAHRVPLGRAPVGHVQPRAAPGARVAGPPRGPVAGVVVGCACAALCVVEVSAGALHPEASRALVALPALDAVVVRVLRHREIEM